MPSAKQQPSNIKHDVGIRPNVCKLTFGPPCTISTVKLLNVVLISLVIPVSETDSLVQRNIKFACLMFNEAFHLYWMPRNCTILGSGGTKDPAVPTLLCAFLVGRQIVVKMCDNLEKHNFRTIKTGHFLYHVAIPTDVSLLSLRRRQSRAAGLQRKTRHLSAR